MNHKRYVYTYAANTQGQSGNILQETVSDLNDDVVTNTITNTYTYGNNSWGDLLTQYKGQNITYDAIGNPLTYRDGITFTWSNGRQLASYNKGTASVSYTYDNNGMRLSKNVNGTQYTYLYLGGLLMQETVGEKILNFFYDSSGQAIGFKYRSSQNSNGSYYYYMYNSRGDILGFYDYTGAVYVTYTYDAWGKVTSVKNSSGQNVISPDLLANIQPLRYRGYVYDNETGLYYLQSRYYDPVTRRFINADSLVSTGTNVLGFNMFVYCNNSPIMLMDDGGDRPAAGTSLNDESHDERKDACKHRRMSKPTSNTTIIKQESTEAEFTFDRIIHALFSSMRIHIGFGVGFFGSVTLDDVEISGGARITMLSLVLDHNGLDIGREAKHGAEVGPVGLYGGYYHSLLCPEYQRIGQHDEETCLYARKYVQGEPSYSIGFGIDIYCLLGVNINIEWDLDAFDKALRE